MKINASSVEKSEMEGNGLEVLVNWLSHSVI
jgi:hypothetical protein